MKVLTNMATGSGLGPAPGAPSPIFWMPETISRSPALRPLLDDVVVAD